jgi:hypothetical protein
MRPGVFPEGRRIAISWIFGIVFLAAGRESPE